MKKLISLIVCAAICLCCFASCSNTQAPPLTEVYDSLKNVTNMPEMTVMPDSLIETLFGFDLSKFGEYVFAEAADPSVNADTIILIKLNDNADLTPVCDTLDIYLAGVKENTKSYSPVNYAKTQSSAVTIIDNYIYLVITSEYFEAQQIIQNALYGGNTKSAVQTLVNK
ncbi:MAG: DUF4358 domain-containing protein [Clostridia bacterium]|nr:DUF4358 domain-containing protein [Clostridia bacterium]